MVTILVKLLIRCQSLESCDDSDNFILWEWRLHAANWV